MSAQKGFTLVEVAIVMAIIAILIGGILKGTEMIENAKMTRTIKEIREVQAMTATFQDKYGQIPGDIQVATSRIPNCAAPLCTNGNGNSIIGNPFAGPDGTIGDSQVGRALSCGGTCSEMETLMFWQHLALADFITSVVPFTTIPTAATAAWGETHPASSLVGGIHIAAKTRRYLPPHDNLADGQFLIYRNSMLGNVNGCPNGACSISYQRGLELDIKIDDGHTVSGFVAIDGSGTCTAPDVSGGGGFTSIGTDILKRKDCNAYVKFW